MKTLIKNTLLIYLLLNLFSCSDGIVSELPDNHVIKIRANYSSIQKEIFNQYCIGCHSGKFPSGNLNLSEGVSYANLINKENNDKTAKYIVQSNVADSYIIERLTSSTNPMPPTGKIDQALIDTLKLWIGNGAISD